MIEYSSFRDPSGFVFWKNNNVYRQVNQNYKQQYDHLMNSGLYEKLIENHLLLPVQAEEMPLISTEGYCIIKPDKVKFISYPYEWSFSQLKDAALTTLKLHKTALQYGMILKDASAYNIQFVDGIPKLIDTLSFDFYQDGMVWPAYGQFCRHFLSSLYLMADVDIRLLQLLRIYIDGIPIDLTSNLMNGKGGGFGAKQHIHMHARMIKKHSQDGKTNSQIKQIKISKFNHIALIDSLIRIVEKIKLKGVVTEWMDYYKTTNYSTSAFSNKEEIISEFLDKTNFKTVWDFGANDGLFARLALHKNVSSVVAFDIDPIVTERNYNNAKKNNENILPLLLDLTNPSPGIGFANKERNPIQLRGKPDCIFALAIIHHLAISNNLPFDKIIGWFSELADNLIIEFVPKEDSQVKILLATRNDIFTMYNQENFKETLKKYYNIVETKCVKDSFRTIYLCKKGENIIE